MPTKKECEAEVMELRKQIEELTAQQEAREEKVKKQPDPEDAVAKEEADEGDFSQIREKLEEFADLLQQDLKQISVTIAVAIFAVGVIFGRLMPR